MRSKAELLCVVVARMRRLLSAAVDADWLPLSTPVVAAQLVAVPVAAPPDLVAAPATGLPTLTVVAAAVIQSEQPVVVSLSGLQIVAVAPAPQLRQQPAVAAAGCDVQGAVLAVAASVFAAENPGFVCVSER